MMRCYGRGRGLSGYPLLGAMYCFTHAILTRASVLLLGLLLLALLLLPPLLLLLSLVVVVMPPLAPPPPLRTAAPTPPPPRTALTWHVERYSSVGL